MVVTDMSYLKADRISNQAVAGGMCKVVRVSYIIGNSYCESLPVLKEMGRWVFAVCNRGRIFDRSTYLLMKRIRYIGRVKLCVFT